MKLQRKTAVIHSSTIQLDQLIKWIGLSETGGQARKWIDEGEVSVNGKRVIERRKKIFPDDIVAIGVEEYKVIFEELKNDDC